MQNRIIAVDFDGTLCKNAWPRIGKPNLDVITDAIQAKRRGAKLILWTCREGERLTEAVAWCERQGILFDAVNANLPEHIAEFGGDCRKVYADEYWDDRNVVVRDGRLQYVLRSALQYGG